VIRKPDKALAWQSKAILLLVVPWTAASVILQAHWWITQVPVVAWTTLGISGIFGLIVWWMKAGTPAAAATGAAITASLMFSTTRYPYKYSCLHGALMPLLAVFLLTYVATKIGRTKKERLGTGESRQGRNAAQVAANLGAAALVASLGSAFVEPSQGQASDFGILLGFAALAEAAADTVSSEIGQVFGGLPRMITTLRRVEPGTDGAITVAGTLAGVLAALLVVGIGYAAVYGFSNIKQIFMLMAISATGGIVGLLFDSFLGATLERRARLNNDTVNFLSTVAAVLFAFLGLVVMAGFTAR